MKTKIPVLIAKAGVAIFVILCFFSYLTEIIQPKSMVLVNFWTFFCCIIVVAGVIFSVLVEWEISTGRVERSTAGPKNSKYLFSTLMLNITGGSSFFLLLLTLVTLFPSIDNLLGRIWIPLKIFTGWTSIITAIILLFITLISFFLRDERIYRPAQTVEKTIDQSIAQSIEN